MAKTTNVPAPEATNVAQAIALLFSFSQEEATEFLTEWNNNIDLYNIIHGVAMPHDNE